MTLEQIKNSAQIENFEMRSPLKIWHQKGYALQKGNERLGAARLDFILTTLIRGELNSHFIRP